MGMKQTQKRLSIPAEGVVPARLARVVELGNHDTKYKDEDTGEVIAKNLVQLWYSLPTRLIEDEGDYKGKQHHLRTQRMNNSTSEKANLWDHRKVLDRNTTDFNDLLGKPCFVTIVHNEVESGGSVTTYANLMNISGVPEGIDVGELDTTPFYFDFDNPDPDVWTKHLWDGIRDTIKDANDYPGSKVEEMVLRLEAMAGEAE